MLRSSIRPLAAALCTFSFALFFLATGVRSFAQAEHSSSITATVRGRVSVGELPIHNASVRLVPGGRTARTSEQGEFEFREVPTGTYDVVVHAPAMADQRKTVTVTAEGVVAANFDLKVAPVTEHVTVTATGSETTTFKAIPSTTSLDSIAIAQSAQPSLGEALDNQPGVSQRGFGPGSSRPVIRGFSGDRVLVMHDGIATGSLGSQSGDHGEPIDILNLKRVEIVRGPATLLYGSTAIGGAVNAISGNFEPVGHPEKGFRGYATGVGGTNNNMGSSSAGVTYTWKKWRIFAGGDGQRTDDYHTPIGTIANSRGRNFGGFGGLGWTGDKAYFTFGYNYDNRNYGVPFAVFLESGGTTGPQDENVSLRLRTHDFKLVTGIRDLDGWISGARAIFNFTRYRHGEFEGDVAGTRFKNDQFNYRIIFHQKKHGLLSGSFGGAGVRRDFAAIGAEALAPPTLQDSVSLFALQSLDFERIGFQFGGRYEHVGYATVPSFDPPRANRTFNGASAALGSRIPLWKGGAFVANYTHSFRAPALEELYNHGPHPGNLSFEVGNDDLKPEQGDGIDLSLRQQSPGFRGEANFFYYRLRDYVFLAPTGNIQDGLFEAEYLQGRTRYIGGEVSMDIAAGPYVWVHAGMDAVSAQLLDSVTSPTTGAVAASGTGLPRIPPIRGNVGLSVNYRSFRIRPEVVIAGAQEDLFTNETRTAGYTVFNLGASYTVARTHAVHVFSINAFNLGDRLYRNHVSFIKDLAPEIGRGVRFSYTVRFF
jgi:iron complex outermembrane receptor protein